MILGKAEWLYLETLNRLVMKQVIISVDQYFSLTMTDANKPTVTFLTVLGNETYNLFRNLLLPEVSPAKTTEVLLEVLKENLQPQPIFDG